MAIREDFPFFQQQGDTHPYYYFDSAATSLTPIAVIEAMNLYYEQFNANIDRSVHRLSQQATQAYEQARVEVANYLQVAPHEVIFTSGTTASLNALADRLVRQLVQPGDEIWLTALEHHANLIPWQVLAQQTGAVLRFLPVTSDYQIDVTQLAHLDMSHAKVLTIHHISNVLGVEQPLAEIVQWAKSHQLCVIVDGAQAVAHLDESLKGLAVDAYCFSGHKIYGPTGIGVCYLDEKWHDICWPFQYGGGMIHTVELTRSTFADAPQKFEGGTPPIAEAIGLAKALNWLVPYRQAMPNHIADLTERLAQGLRQIEGIHVYGAANGIVSFNLEGVHPHDMATAYDEVGIAVRAGHHCAQPLMREFQVHAMVRASLALYNTQAEVDYFLTQTQQIKEFFAQWQ